MIHELVFTMKESSENKMEATSELFLGQKP